MAQGVDGGRLVDTALLQGSLERPLHPAGGERFLRGGDGLSREEPGRVTMGKPMSAQKRENRFRQGDVAVAVAFGLADVQLHPLAVHIADLQADAFLQAQAAAIDHAEAGAVGRVAQASQNGLCLVG